MANLIFDKVLRNLENTLKWPNECIDCRVIISAPSTRCRSCANRNRTGKFKWSNEAKESIMGEKNSAWKGNKVSLNSLHLWLRFHYPKPLLCERCGQGPPYDLANISGEYTRNIEDYQWMCRKCHVNFDRGGMNG